MLRVTLGDTDIRIKNILYFIFFQPPIIGKHGKKDIGGCWIGKKKIAFAQ
jgi:hypothetical protein